MYPSWRESCSPQPLPLPSSSLCTERCHRQRSLPPPRVPPLTPETRAKESLCPAEGRDVPAPGSPGGHSQGSRGCRRLAHPLPGFSRHRNVLKPTHTAERRSCKSTFGVFKSVFTIWLESSRTVALTLFSLYNSDFKCYYS